MTHIINSDSYFVALFLPQIGSLIITSVRKRDSGNYTCSPSNSDDVTVMLHVINGESQTAITTAVAQESILELVIQ